MKKLAFVLLVLALISGLAPSFARAEALGVSMASPTPNQSIPVNQLTNFSAQASGGDATNYSYVWNFGDGTFGAGANYQKAYTESGSMTISVTVTDFAGAQVTLSRQITVTGATPAVTVDLKANGQDSLSGVGTSTPITLSWTSSNATACTASGATDWTGSQATSGSQTVTTTSAANSSVTYTLNCTDANNNASSDSVEVTTSAGVNPQTLTVDLKANGQDSLSAVATSTGISLTWTSSNATACIASGASDWTGTKSVSGSASVTSPSGANTTTTYTLTCTGNNNSSGSDSVVVTTVGSGVTLVITNVRVTDITTNSVIVRWDTNLPATSRVLYDTSSHSDISGQTGPNYGYASSTGTSDVDTKVTTHAVSVTGLSANTTYYFRAVSEN